MKHQFLSATLLIGTLLLQSCENTEKKTTILNEDSTDVAILDTNSNKKPHLKPKGEKPTWAPNIDDEMAVVIEKLQSYGAPALETLSAKEARKQPTPTTAVMDIIKEYKIEVPPSKVDTIGKDISVKGGKIHVRIYTPQTADSTFPVIVYYHGGGWVIADLDVYDASAKGLAEIGRAHV